jgi:TusE/DsrC/DsvC family sulfur relay protein
MNASTATVKAYPLDEIGHWFDIDGFLMQPDRWDYDLAQRIADAEGMDLLSPKHWEVINYVRGRFFLNGSLPVMRLVCRASGLDRHKAHKLFGSCRSLWRVAGLPNPGEEAKSYME